MTTYTLTPTATNLLTAAAHNLNTTPTPTGTLTFNATTGTLHLPITYQRVAHPALNTIHTQPQNEPAQGTWRTITPIPANTLTNLSTLTFNNGETPTLTFTYQGQKNDETYTLTPSDHPDEPTPVDPTNRIPLTADTRTRISTALTNSHHLALGNYWEPIRGSHPATAAIGTNLISTTRPTGVNLLTFTTTEGKTHIRATNGVGTTTEHLHTSKDTTSNETHTVYASTISSVLTLNINELGFTPNALHLYDNTGVLVATAPTYETPLPHKPTDKEEKLSATISKTAAQTIYTALTSLDADNTFLALAPHENTAYIFNDVSGHPEPIHRLELAEGDLTGDTMFFASPAATLLTRHNQALHLTCTQNFRGKHLVTGTNDTLTITTYRQPHREHTLSVVQHAFTS